MWRATDVPSTHNLQAVTCGDYVAALEKLVLELGGDPTLALDSCVAGTGGAKPASDAGTETDRRPCAACGRPTPDPVCMAPDCPGAEKRVYANTVTWREVVEQTCAKLNPGGEGHA